MNPDLPVVTASGVEAVYPTGDGVGPLELIIEPGESVLVLGPSGSGKSTVLRLLHGAVPQAIDATVTGEVRVAGRRVADVGIADLADVVGVVAQDPESGVCLTEVADEVAFGLENLAVDPAEIGPAVDAALDRAGAAALRDRATAELSGGELQRVALAAAIAPGPRLLLLDEPTSMLDADGIDAVRQAIDAAGRATGAARILVEHRLDELADDGSEFTGDELDGLPERWIVLGRDGRIRYDGPPRGLSSTAVRDLVAQGCWLPIDLELWALFDHDGGLDHATVQTALLDSTWAEPTDPTRRESVEGLGTTQSPSTGSGDVSTGSRSPSTGSGDALAGAGRAVSASSECVVAKALTVGRGSRSNRRPVLTGVDLELRPGEISALVGANGSGKSTLLACLAGLERPIAGEVTGPRPGLVFQNPEHQFATATVRAELSYGLEDPPNSVTEPNGAIEDMLRRFELTGLADHNPYRLSGGQQRRVSLAAMLLHGRPFLFADEPGFGLDRLATIAAMQALRETAREGRGVLFSSHDLRAVAGYADRVLVLGDGRLLADTTPLRLLRDHALLARARLRPTRLIRWLADQVDDDVRLRGILQRLDDLTARLGTESEVRK